MKKEYNALLKSLENMYGQLIKIDRACEKQGIPYNPKIRAMRKTLLRNIKRNLDEVKEDIFDLETVLFN